VFYAECIGALWEASGVPRVSIVGSTGLVEYGKGAGIRPAVYVKPHAKGFCRRDRVEKWCYRKLNAAMSRLSDFLQRQVCIVSLLPYYYGASTSP